VEGAAKAIEEPIFTDAATGIKGGFGDCGIPRSARGMNVF
jgi:hypothetical protein